MDRTIRPGDWVKDDSTRISEVQRTRERDPFGLDQVVQTTDEDWLRLDDIVEVRPAGGVLGHLKDVHLVEHTGTLEGQLQMAPGEIQVAQQLGQRMMLRNAVALLDRMVMARVLSHGGPDGLERDARRIVNWYKDLPADQRDMTMHVGVDWGSGPDQAVTVTRNDTP